MRPLLLSVSLAALLCTSQPCPLLFQPHTTLFLLVTADSVQGTDSIQISRMRTSGSLVVSVVVDLRRTSPLISIGLDDATYPWVKQGSLVILVKS